MYSFIVSALSIVSPSKFPLACSFALSLLSSSTILLNIFHASDGAWLPRCLQSSYFSLQLSLGRSIRSVIAPQSVCHILFPALYASCPPSDVRRQRFASTAGPYGVREKSAAAILSVLKRFVADMQVPRAFRTDNGTEYSKSMFVDFCNGLGIRREFTAPYTSQQNGPVESAISRAFKAGHAARLGVPQLYPDIHLEEIRSCTDAAGTSLWLESLLWASECYNRAATSVNDE